MTLTRYEDFSGWRKREIEIDNEFIEFLNSSVRLRTGMNDITLTEDDIKALYCSGEENEQRYTELKKIELTTRNGAVSIPLTEMLFDIIDEALWDADIADESEDLEGTEIEVSAND